MYPRLGLVIQAIWLRLLSFIALTLLLAACGQEAPARVQTTESDATDSTGNTPPVESLAARQPDASPAPTEPPVASPAPEEQPVATTLLTEEQRAVGDPDAPITMVVYSDFQ
ncbi:MAG: hypothetical protein GFH27_549281n251 [Chloroflexi bacterium AL-W]|nr:hypothetical protein [Chloroflexi bacterium AL-N1]NOK66136.1 hypothetical protein [Chloroflexi bacterium AL-N10]NOK73017.1 hypothetical protein [Chloroflexi bacterium AL-N5]NOK79914.1 hypothetical protein [Chloroflexi bacterium AL-W]NOK88230.1 hypothetical protein [Chloroflexi bacterium AL-N15]